MIRNTVIIILVIFILYRMEVSWVVWIVDGFPALWNEATIYIMTFRDRHPLIFTFLPIMCILLMLSMRNIDANL